MEIFVDISNYFLALKHVPVRRSSRHGKPPKWMKDYVGRVDLSIQPTTQTSGHTLPISSLLIDSYTQFLFNVTSVHESKSYKEASHIKELIEAMNKELIALEENHTLDLVPLPAGKKPIGCKWVYKTKLKANGKVERHKARLMAKGYNQQYGIDYLEVFSPVAKLVTVRTLLALATIYGWLIHQIDVNNAFLHVFLHDDIYMTPLQGYHKAKKGEVCKLVKRFYGLKQASREWNAEFCSKLFSQGFTQSTSDHCSFVKSSGQSFLCLQVYVDDVLIMGPYESLITRLKSFHDGSFTIKDLGHALYFQEWRLQEQTKAQL